MMGGNIDMDSFPGRGTKFWFTINLLESKEAATQVEYSFPSEYRHMRILCVDDNTINRDIIKRHALNWELNCDVAVNAAEGLSMMRRAAADNQPYALVLSDHIMPGMSGFEMVEIMRRLKEIAKTPVIMLSSLGTAIGEDEMIKYEIAATLTKPLRTIRLYETIIDIFSGVMGFGEKTLETSHKDEIPLNDNVRILLAEDNSINQLVAIKILNRLGYTAETVSNGLEAVKSAEAKDYDLILMDCQMPELDGYAATEMLRKHEETSGRHTLVIAMTAHALKGDREKCLSAGMDDYLTKPIDMKALDQMLAKWLNKLKTGEVQRQKSTQHKPQPALNKAAEHSESMHASVRASSTPDQKQVEEKENLPELRSKIIDMERIHDIFGDNSETIKLFIQTFIQSTDETLTEPR
jgi:two-component system sensor histidine kinase/response regulator